MWKPRSRRDPRRTGESAVRAALGAASLLALAGALSACGSGSSSGLSSGMARGSSRPSAPALVNPANITPLGVRFDAIVGRTLVVPVSLSGTGGTDGRGATADLVRVLMDDGTVVPAGLYRVDVAAGGGPTGWLSSPGTWKSWRASEAGGVVPDAATRVSWVLLADIPEGERPARLRVGGVALDLRWLDLDPTARSVARPIVPDARTAGVPRASILAPEFASPTRRWRGWLATRSAVLGPTNDSQRFSDPAVEALAAYTEGRWSFALARLAREDRSTCDRLVAVLSATADFGGGQAVPVWPESEVAAEALLGDLLDPALDAAGRRERVEAWLGAQRPIVLWVQDDAGRIEEASGKPAGVLGIVNLGEKREIARVEIGERVRDGREPLVVEPGVVRRVPIVADDPAAEVPPRPVPVRVRVGATGVMLPAVLRHVASDPPGLVLSPFLDDLTLATWSAGEMRPASGDGREVAAMLFRSVKGEWIVHVEAAGFEAAPEQSTGGTPVVVDPRRVRIWLGVVGKDRVIEVSPSGAATGRDSLGRAVAAECRAATAGGRWAVQVVVPPECIESSGVLRVGIERVLGDGSRSAFPRPMLPWQDAPGRVAIDTSGW